ncbi:MAG: aldolase/citrate lyase family protein [Thermoanaerobaculia bacterium]
MQLRASECGRTGDDARSDLHVAIEPRKSGGIEVALSSKVAIYFEESIRADVARVVTHAGIKDALVTVDDQGALPFVIAARTEAAARRAGATGRVAAEHLPLPAPSAKDRIRRSRLYLPGNEPKYMINAALYGPDGVILDLEDSVHRNEKDAARILVRNALRSVDFGTCERMVRINQLPRGLEDLDEIVPEQPDLILIPKVETSEEVVAVDERISAILSKEKSDRPMWLMPILETALGIENAFAIAKASPRVCALTIGLEDYTADLGVVKTKEGDETLYARLRLVNAARAAGIQAIDSVYGDVGDMEGLHAWGERARGLGFSGMGCIHPLQIQVIHEAFAPTKVEIDKALKIVAAFEDAQAKGLAVVSLGSKMIDPPVVLRAQRLVERAKAMGLV